MGSELQNSDFRVFLNNLPEEKGMKNRTEVEKVEKIDQVKKKRKKENEIEDDVEKGKVKTKYRNRAEERRRGIIKDIEDETVLYNNKHNTIDESKFMGGDVEHTHLVKGLDYLLLKKVRADLNHDKEGKSCSFITGGKNKIEEDGKYLSDLQSDDHSKQIYKCFFLHEHPHHKDFKNRVKNISDSIMEKNMKFHSYNKTIHNTFYKCNLNIELDVDDIPPKYIVEKKEIQRITTNFLGEDYLKEIGECFNWHSENKKRKKGERLLKRTSHFLQNKENENDDVDIDIFSKSDNEEDKDSNSNESRVEMESSEDSGSSDGSIFINKNKSSKVETSMGILSTTKNISQKEKKYEEIIDNLQSSTKFGMRNNEKNDDKHNNFGNAFKDTYDECYPQ